MSSSEDNSDGAEAVLDFDKIDRIRESVSFDDCAEQLAINDYQGMNLYIYIYVYIYIICIFILEWRLVWRLPGLQLRNYHDYQWTSWMVGVKHGDDSLKCVICRQIQTYHPWT